MYINTNFNRYIQIPTFPIYEYGTNSSTISQSQSHHQYSYIKRKKKQKKILKRVCRDCKWIFKRQGQLSDRSGEI